MDAEIISHITDEKINKLLHNVLIETGRNYQVTSGKDNIMAIKGEAKPRVAFAWSGEETTEQLKAYQSAEPQIPIIILVPTSKEFIQLKHQGFNEIIPIEHQSTEMLSVFVDCCIRRFIAEFKVKQNNLRHKLVTKAINNIVWDWQLKNKHAIWLGTGVQTILGYDQEELVIENNFWENHIHPDDRDRVTSRLNKIIGEAKETSWSDEYLFETRNGEYKLIHDKGVLLYKEGKLERMIGSMEDITSIKIAEEATKKLEFNYKKLFNFIPLPSFIWDIENYDILEVNEMATHQYGYTREEFLNMTVLQLRPPSEVPNFINIVTELNQQNALSFERVWEHVTKTGEKILMQISSYKINFQDKYVTLALAHNITEKTALQEKLRIAHETRQQQIAEAVVVTQENERTRIARELHDNVNQLLGASRLYIEAAKKDKEGFEEMLGQASGYIMNAIEEIRVLSRTLNTPLVREMGLKETVENLCSDLSLVNEAILEVHLDEFDENGYDDNVKITIYRIIQEQLTNIFKYANATHVRIEIRNKNNGIEMMVQDDGIGFNTHLHTNGIGLKNIYSRSALYKGEIDLISTPGNGCALKIFFPVSVTKPGQAEAN